MFSRRRVTRCSGRSRLIERAARWPWTPTGTNLLGLVKHAAGVEVGYFGQTFGREWPSPDEMPWIADDAEDDADMWATVDEPVDAAVDLYRRVWAFADETIATRDLDATAGRVSWWPAERADVTPSRSWPTSRATWLAMPATRTSCAS